ncbi:MAG: alpha/beta fold hydrolase [Pseudomonadota bacterium]
MRILITALLGLSVLTLAACQMASNSVNAVADMATPDYDPLTQDPELSVAFPPALEELNFQSQGARLNGLIYVANGEGPHPTVVLLHGYPGNEKNLDLAQDLRRAGFNVLFFHYRGAWGSGGRFSFANGIEDVGAALDFLRDPETARTYRVDPNKITLIGHSYGGFTALQAAAKDDSVTCVGGMAAADFGAIASSFENAPQARARFSAYADSLTMLAGQTGASAIAELDANRLGFDLRALSGALDGKRVLLVAARSDTAVPADRIHTPMVAAYSANAGIDLEHKLLPGDHSFSWSRKALSRTVLRWVEDCR